jgi:hypothetical protein
MGGEDEADAGGSSRRTGGGEDRSSGFLGLFGGRGDEGRVRL